LGSALTVCSTAADFGQQDFALIDQLKDFLEFDGPALQPNHLIFILRVYESLQSLSLSRFQKF
jgi:hypothetical protein